MLAVSAIWKTVVLVLIFALLETSYGQELNPNKNCPQKKECLRIPHDCATGPKARCDCVALVEVTRFSSGTLLFQATRKGDDGYIAIGISKDRVMGNDIVVACLPESVPGLVEGTGSRVVALWTTDTPNKNATTPPPGPSPVNGNRVMSADVNKVNGTLFCSFTLTPPFEYAGIPIFSFDQPHVLFMAMGRFRPTFPFITDHARTRADEPFALWNNTAISPNETVVTCDPNATVRTVPPTTGSITNPGQVDTSKPGQTATSAPEMLSSTCIGVLGTFRYQTVLMWIMVTVTVRSLLFNETF